MEAENDLQFVQTWCLARQLTALDVYITKKAESTMRYASGGDHEVRKVRHYPFTLTRWRGISVVQLLRKIVWKPRTNFVFVQTWCLARQLTALDVYIKKKAESTMRNASGGDREVRKSGISSHFYPMRQNFESPSFVQNRLEDENDFLFVQTWCLARQSTALDVYITKKVESTVRNASGGHRGVRKVRHFPFTFTRWGRISRVQFLRKIVWKPRTIFNLSKHGA